MTELQAVGFVPLLVGAGGDDGAATPLGTRLIRAGAKQQRVAQLPRDPLEKLPQGLRDAEQRTQLIKESGFINKKVFIYKTLYFFSYNTSHFCVNRVHLF